MEAILQVEGLWKKYSRDLNASVRYAARELLRGTFGNHEDESLRETEFWALRDINFTLQRGQVLAVLGHNGAGKSTLLKCIAGKLRIDRGRVTRRGELGHLLEMSAGFVPTMTGRDNVSVRGRLMGKRGKELERYVAQVAEFAEIDEFFDSPVQFYSSGMKSRLGFAASSVIEPDILILDEVLAVGDLGFRMKCYARIDELRNKCAVILVTHSMNHVSRMADSAIVLEKGKVAFQGSPQKGIERYNEAVKGKSNKPISYMPERIEFEVLNNGAPLATEAAIEFGEELSIHGENRADAPVSISIVLRDQSGTPIADWNSKRSKFTVPSQGRFVADLGKQHLCPGYYYLALVGSAVNGEQLFLSAPFHFQVSGDYFGGIRFQPVADWRAPT